MPSTRQRSKYSLTMLTEPQGSRSWNGETVRFSTCWMSCGSRRRLPTQNLSSAGGWIPVNIPGTTYNKALKARKKVLESIHQLLKQRRADKENMVAHADLLDSLLNSVENGVQLSDKQVADNIVTILFAGHDTSSIALVWTLYNLILYPDVLKQVQLQLYAVEKLSVVHQAENDALARAREQIDDPPAWNDLQKLPFTFKVIQETL